MKCNHNDIIYRQYCCKLRGKEGEIQKYLKLLTPRNCYIISRNEAYGSLPGLRTEPYYDSKFLVEPIDSAFLDMLEKVMPTRDMEIHHAEENPFMPKNALISKKVIIKPEQDYPKLISKKPNIKSDVYFR